ncbi:MAG: PIN domain-containing protein [Bacillota bacterium]
MGVAGFLSVVKEKRAVLIDTNVAIYFLEGSPVFGEAAKGLFRSVQAGEVQAYLSVVSTVELLVKPIRVGNDELVQKIRLFLEHFPNLRLCDVTRRIALEAAGVRAKTNLKVPDSILVATASVYGCALVGNDLDWSEKDLGVPYICLGKYL